MKRMALLLLLAIVHLYSIAHAEGGCPPGQYPQSGQGWQSCVPIPGYTQGSNSSTPPQRWVSKWQAIATDVPQGILGTSKDVSTADESEKVAIADCRAKGGVTCEIQISYRNGCVAMAVGEKTSNVRGAATLDAAEATSMDECSKGNTKCVVYYSACSLAVRVQ